MAASQDVAPTNKSVKLKRPDATDPKRYKNINNWSSRKWAWEFLRRNEKFISECRRLKNSSDKEKQEMALTFGLKKFKDFHEPYFGENGAPKFDIGSITSWTNIESAEKVRQQKVKISFGQILVRFDLSDMIAAKKAYAKQLRLTEALIKTKLTTYAALVNKKQVEHKPQYIAFGIYIRLLDYLATKKSHLECAKLIFPDEAKTKGNQELLTLVNKLIPAAKKHANEEYKYLSLLVGKPKSKVIKLQK